MCNILAYVQSIILHEEFMRLYEFTDCEFVKCNINSWKCLKSPLLFDDYLQGWGLVLSRTSLEQLCLRLNLKWRVVRCKQKKCGLNLVLPTFRFRFSAKEAQCSHLFKWLWTLEDVITSITVIRAKWFHWLWERCVFKIKYHPFLTYFSTKSFEFATNWTENSEEII